MAQAQANLARAQANLDKIKAGARIENIAVAQAAVEAAQANYEQAGQCGSAGQRRVGAGGGLQGPGRV